MGKCVEDRLLKWEKRFSILLRIELVFGAKRIRPSVSSFSVSVSSCGSSWFLGFGDALGFVRCLMFQYPLADRVGFWGCLVRSGWAGIASFSILLRIELVFGGRLCFAVLPPRLSFSILLRIELVFGASRRRWPTSAWKVSVSSCGSSWFLGLPHRPDRRLAAAVSVSSCGSSWFLGA